MVNGDGDYVKGNCKYYAVGVTGGGGPLQVGSLDKVGRLGSQPKLTVHKAKVFDFDFHPFIDEMIATGSEDCLAKVTRFPEGGVSENITDSDCTLEGHQKKLCIVKFHPTAMNVLATGSFDYSIKIWDVEKQSEICEYTANTDVPTSFDWNTNGSLAVTTCKDKMMRVFDPRNPGTAQECKGFEGGKKPTAVWADNHNKIVGVGFTKNSNRAYALYDTRKLDKAMQEVDIDQSAGTFMCKYDPDNSVLYLAGKGDSSVKYFEITEEDPYVHFLSEFRHSESTKGIGWLPKRACNTGKCEVMRALRLLRDKIQPVSFQVPRKSEMFQADIFPDTYAGEATQTADEYAGGGNADPKLQSMNPKNAPGEKKAVVFEKKRSAPELERLLAAAEARIKELEAQLAKK